MKTIWMRMALKWAWIGWPMILPKVVLLVAVFGALTYAAQITIFQDDFESQHFPWPERNPGVPPIGEPWQISEVASDGIAVQGGLPYLDGLALRFGRYRNVAVAPFSVEHRQLIAAAQTVSVSFDYAGYSDESGPYSHYFDVAGYDPVSGEAAFFVRFAPQQNLGSDGVHDVFYLDPQSGLVNSGLDFTVYPFGEVQPITIVADFAAETYDLGVGGGSTTLPMFVCPNEIAGVEFANYGIAIGSGAIDNLDVTVPDASAGLEATTRVPEIATILLLLIGALTLACARLLRRKAK